MKTKLIAYTVTQTPDIIRPANPKREWMDNSNIQYAYRCLPLSMANSWGWEVLSSAKFTVTWNGGQAPHDVVIDVHSGRNPPSSIFGEGTVTWHTGYLFKTQHPIGMYTTGAPNNPKPNTIPLSGIVETNWVPYTFTMNWRFTQPGSFTMEIGEPYCQIFPIDLTTFDEMIPEIRSLHEDKEFHDLYWDWNIARGNFIVESRIPGSGKSQSWQKHYIQGKYPAGTVHPEGSRCPVHINESGEVKSMHRTKPNVSEFVDLQIGPFKPVEDYRERRQEVKDKYINHLKQQSGNQEEQTEKN